MKNRLDTVSETANAEDLQRPCQSTRVPQFKYNNTGTTRRPLNSSKLPAKYRGSSGSLPSEESTPQPPSTLIPYTKQTNLSRYTIGDIVRRQKLKETDEVRKWLDAWWQATKTQVYPHVYGITRETYMQVMVILQLVLAGAAEDKSTWSGHHAVKISEQRFADAVAVVELDWDRDVQLQNVPHASFLTEETWKDSLFELADIWCDSTEEKEYCQFLGFCLAYYIFISSSSYGKNVDTRNTRKINPEILTSYRSKCSDAPLTLKPNGIPFSGIHWRLVALPEHANKLLYGEEKSARRLLEKAFKSFDRHQQDFFEGHQEKSEKEKQNGNLLFKNFPRTYNLAITFGPPSPRILESKWRPCASADLYNAFKSAVVEETNVQQFIQLGKWRKDEDGRIYNKSLDDELKLLVGELIRRKLREELKRRYFASSNTGRLWYKNRARSRNGSGNKDSEIFSTESEEDDTDATMGKKRPSSGALSASSFSSDTIGDSERKGLNLYWRNVADVRDWELLGVRPIKKPEYSANKTKESREDNADVCSTYTGSVFVGEPQEGWLWIAEVPIDHRYNPMNPNVVDQRTIRSSRLQRIGVFSDQLSAALAYDAVVRIRRVQCGLELDPEYVNKSLINEKDMETIEQKIQENDARRHRPPALRKRRLGNEMSRGAKVAPREKTASSSSSASADTSSFDGSFRENNVAPHCLFTNFSIAGHLLEPPDHLRVPRKYWPSSLGPSANRTWQKIERHLGKEARWKTESGVPVYPKSPQSSCTYFSGLMHQKLLKSTGLWQMIVHKEFCREDFLAFYFDLKLDNAMIPPKRAKAHHYRKKLRKHTSQIDWNDWQKRYKRALTTELRHSFKRDSLNDCSPGDADKAIFRQLSSLQLPLYESNEVSLLNYRGRAFIRQASKISNSLGYPPEEILKRKQDWVEKDTPSWLRHRALLSRQLVIATLRQHKVVSPELVSRHRRKSTLKTENKSDETEESRRRIAHSALSTLISLGIPARLTAATVPLGELDSSTDLTQFFVEEPSPASEHDIDIFAPSESEQDIHGIHTRSKSDQEVAIRTGPKSDQEIGIHPRPKSDQESGIHTRPKSEQEIGIHTQAENERANDVYTRSKSEHQIGCQSGSGSEHELEFHTRPDGYHAVKQPSPTGLYETKNVGIQEEDRNFRKTERDLDKSKEALFSTDLYEPIDALEISSGTSSSEFEHSDYDSPVTGLDDGMEVPFSASEEDADTSSREYTVRIPSSPSGIAYSSIAEKRTWSEKGEDNTSNKDDVGVTSISFSRGSERRQLSVQSKASDEQDRESVAYVYARKSRSRPQQPALSPVNVSSMEMELPNTKFTTPKSALSPSESISHGQFNAPGFSDRFHNQASELQFAGYDSFSSSRDEISKTDKNDTQFKRVLSSPQRLKQYQGMKENKAARSITAKSAPGNDDTEFRRLKSTHYADRTVTSESMTDNTGKGKGKDHVDENVALSPTCIDFSESLEKRDRRNAYSGPLDDVTKTVIRKVRDKTRRLRIMGPLKSFNMGDLREPMFPQENTEVHSRTVSPPKLSGGNQTSQFKRAHTLGNSELSALASSRGKENNSSEVPKSTYLSLSPTSTASTKGEKSSAAKYHHPQDKYELIQPSNYERKGAAESVGSLTRETKELPGGEGPTNERSTRTMRHVHSQPYDRKPSQEIREQTVDDSEPVSPWKEKLIVERVRSVAQTQNSTDPSNTTILQQNASDDVKCDSRDFLSFLTSATPKATSASARHDWTSSDLYKPTSSLTQKLTGATGSRKLSRESPHTSALNLLVAHRATDVQRARVTKPKPVLSARQPLEINQLEIDQEGYFSAGEEICRYNYSPTSLASQRNARRQFGNTLSKRFQNKRNSDPNLNAGKLTDSSHGVSAKMRKYRYADRKHDLEGDFTYTVKFVVPSGGKVEDHRNRKAHVSEGSVQKGYESLNADHEHDYHGVSSADSGNEGGASEQHDGMQQSYSSHDDEKQHVFRLLSSLSPRTTEVAGTAVKYHHHRMPSLHRCGHCDGADDVNRVQSLARDLFERQVLQRVHTAKSLLRNTSGSKSYLSKQSTSLEDPSNLTSNTAGDETLIEQKQSLTSTVISNADPISDSEASKTLYEVLRKKSSLKRPPRRRKRRGQKPESSRSHRILRMPSHEMSQP